jgi:hypothetical protein
VHGGTDGTADGRTKLEKLEPTDDADHALHVNASDQPDITALWLKLQLAQLESQMQQTTERQIALNPNSTSAICRGLAVGWPWIRPRQIYGESTALRFAADLPWAGRRFAVGLRKQPFNLDLEFLVTYFCLCLCFRVTSLLT